jgi:V-type H+-transporting ATPase subunit E
MLEPAVTVHARKKDVSIVERAAQGAKAQYKDISGRDVNITVEGSLANDGCGINLFFFSRLPG